MKILNLITLRYLKMNKSRTLVTIVGIIISAAMISAVTTIISSFKTWMTEGIIMFEGSYHLYTYSAPVSDIESATSDPDVKDSATLYYHSFMKAPSLKTARENFYGYYMLTSMSEGFTDIKSVHIYEGRMPERSDEIMLPSNLGIYVENVPKIGDTVSFELGLRKTLDGAILNENDHFIVDETREDREEFHVSETREFTVVGFFDSSLYSFGLENIYSSGIRVVTYDCNIAPEYAKSYIVLNDPSNYVRFSTELWDEYKLDTYRNYDYLSLTGAIPGSGYDVIFVVLGGTLIFIIAIASLSLIGSTFSISVTERTKQFGLLSSIGATKKQIRRSVIDEAMLISIIAIPIGILSGIAGIAVTFYFLEDQVRTMLFEFINASANEIRIRVVPTFAAIMLAVVAGVFTVYISACIPVYRAMKMSPLDAIRSSKDVKNKPRSLKTSPLTEKILGVEGMLAAKYFKRSKKKYRATVISITISVVLFILAGTFTDYLGSMLKASYSGYDYDYFVMLHTRFGSDSGREDRDDITNAIINSPSAKNVLVSQPLSGFFLFNSDDFNDKWREEYRTADISVIVINDEAFSRYLRENGLSEKKYMDPENREFLFSDLSLVPDLEQNKTIIINRFKNENAKIECALDATPAVEIIARLNQETEMIVLSESKKEIPLRDYNGYAEFRLGKRVEDCPMGYNGRYGLNVFIPKCVAESMLSKLDYDIESPMIYINAVDPENDFHHFEELARAYSGGLSIENVYESSMGLRALFYVFKVLSYGFISLMSLIALINMFSTISTNIFLRKRDLAILSSVGMTSKGTVKMMIYECILYGTKGLVYGLPISVVASMLFAESISDKMDTGIYFPTNYVLISVIAVFAVVAFSMLCSVTRIRKENTVETVRSENA